MSGIKILIVFIVIGEGGLGGVLGFGVVDKVFMFENLVYLVILLEGCVVILYKDLNRVEEVVNNLKLLL